MREIKLTHGYITQVDDEDYEFLNQWKWYVRKRKHTNYVERSSEIINGKQKTIRMHRVIDNTPKELQVDHIDHDGLNNQRNNLRRCTCRQNRMNCKSRGSSKYLGVSFAGKKIRADIRINGKKYFLGYFKTEIEAANKYDEYAKIHHGSYANLNIK